MAWLGLDIGGTRIKAVLWSGDRQLRSVSSETYNRPDAATLIERLRTLTSAVLGNESSVMGVGLCIPGVRSDDHSHIVYSANVPGLEGIMFSDLLAEAGVDDAPFITTSDAFAAANDATEALSLTGRVAFISIGAGVGLAVVDDGEPIAHTDGGAGHLGQVDVSINDDPQIGPDGGRGSLEGYIGASALHRRFGDADDSILLGLQRDHLPLRALARAIRMVHVMYRPDSIVLLGGLGHRLRDTALDEYVNDRLSSLARPNARLLFGVDDYHAARGAAKLALLS